MDLHHNTKKNKRLKLIILVDQIFGRTKTLAGQMSYKYSLKMFLFALQSIGVFLIPDGLISVDAERIYI